MSTKLDTISKIDLMLKNGTSQRTYIKRGIYSRYTYKKPLKSDIRLLIDNDRSIYIEILDFTSGNKETLKNMLYKKMKKLSYTNVGESLILIVIMCLPDETVNNDYIIKLLGGMQAVRPMYNTRIYFMDEFEELCKGNLTLLFN